MDGFMLGVRIETVQLFSVCGALCVKNVHFSRKLKQHLSEIEYL